MKVMRIYNLLVGIGFLFITFAGFAQQNKPVRVDFNSPLLNYMGRVDFHHDKATFYWPGNSVKLVFEGDTVFATLEDKKGLNYFNVILDGDSVWPIRLVKGKQRYLLAGNLPEGRHTIELFRRADWQRGATAFYGFTVSGSKAKAIKTSVKKPLKLEFYGNSITEGYAVEDYSGNDNPDSIFTNNYYSYAAVTARHFNADYYCVAKGGIGIMISWFPLIMPEVYDRVNPLDSNSKWDFSNYTPDIVVINLFQNDSWLVKRPQFREFKHRFGEKPPTEKFIIKSYKDFVEKIRNEYPRAKIICMLGNMDATKPGSPWPGYIQKAVNELNDDNIFTLFVPYKNTPGHPKIEEQQILADSLINLIDRKILKSN